MPKRIYFRALVALAALVAFAAASAPAGAQTGFVTTSDSAKLYYRIIGKGADTIIAIHGGPGMDHESIYGDFKPLAEHHVVIFYDQRGGGKSSLPKDTTQLFAARQVQDLDELRRHFHIERATLVAHSYGPLLAASYALAHPANVKRMVFFGPVPPFRGDFNRRFGQSLNSRLDSAQNARASVDQRRMMDTAVAEKDARAACRDFWSIGVIPRLAEPKLTAPLVKSDFCASDLAGIRYGLGVGNRVIMASYGNWDLRPQLKSLNVPTLIVHGEKESIPMDVVEEWATSMPHARLIKVPRAAHFTYSERPEVVWPAVEKFLSGGG